MPKLTPIDHDPFATDKITGAKFTPVDFNPFERNSDISGLHESGNIDLKNRPIVKNKDGSISTVRSMGINIDGKETLIPTVSEDGRILTPDEAVYQFRKTGKHLGKFNTIEDANKYAKRLHEEQSNLYSPKLDINQIVQDAIRIHATDERGNPRYVGKAEKAAMQKYLIPAIAIQSENGDPLGLRGK